MISKDGRKLAFRGSAVDRYATGEESEIYLLDIASNRLTRVTNNGVSEGLLSFSPDSRWLAFAAPDEFTYMRNHRIYILPVDGGPLRKLGDGFDNHLSLSFWSPDSQSIYFNDQVGATTNIYQINVAANQIHPVTNEHGVVTAGRDEDSGLVLLSYTDPSTPSDLYVTTLSNLGVRSRWTRVTRINPQVEKLALGATESIRWKSRDGALVEGVLVKPLNYQAGRRYPLIVQLHGGPAGAYTLTFSGSHGTYTHIYAANGYVVLQPNYRGSSGYGEKFRTQISGDYFRQAFEDIMTGVDYLIEKGWVDPNAMGMMGWSAGGHWSNWTLVSTDRFKAISTGAGAVNWISLYAQTDVQVPREFYFKGNPYELESDEFSATLTSLFPSGHFQS
ncbi:MAG: S9 family peptidase [Acidobacteria bacterium]|nr:S9 family peptidase [Acidobacteriota bacterium]MBI3658377.1 S9 family peptidase [Acidobacteriota bacterium]